MRQPIAILRNWLAGQTSDRTSCGDSLKGGNTENCDSMGRTLQRSGWPILPLSQRYWENGVTGQTSETRMLCQLMLMKGKPDSLRFAC